MLAFHYLILLWSLVHVNYSAACLKKLLFLKNNRGSVPLRPRGLQIWDAACALYLSHQRPLRLRQRVGISLLSICTRASSQQSLRVSVMERDCGTSCAGLS